VGGQEENELKKYGVTIQFCWQARTRNGVLAGVKDYVARMMYGRAGLIAVSRSPVEYPEDWIALNEPIKGKRGID